MLCRDVIVTGLLASTLAACGPPGGPIDAAACPAAASVIDACPGAVASLYYTGDQCASDPYENCMASCIKDASCADLRQESYLANDCQGGCETNTPLVLSFDGTPVRFALGGGFFDLGLGMGMVTDWPGAATPWLALDRNGNGAVDDGSELFGSATVLRSGALADNGFTALRELDTDGDGWITPADEPWSRLLVWADRNEDRASSPGELVPLSRTGVLRIDLGFTLARRCDARGNCEGERSRFVFLAAGGEERTGEVVDVYLRARPR